MDEGLPKIVVEYAKNAVIVTLTHEKILEESDIEALDGSIMPLIGQEKGIDLVIDFSNVRFLTSAFLGLLIRISKKIYESQGRLRLCAIDSKIFEIFKITRLNKVFDIQADREKAVQSFD